MEDVGRDDRLEVARRPADVDELDRRRQARDGLAGGVGVAVAGHVTPQPDGDLGLGLELPGVAAGILAARLELRRRGEESDHGLPQAQLLLDLRDVQADLPTNPAGAALELRPPRLQLLVKTVDYSRVDSAHSAMTIFRASLRS